MIKIFDNSAIKLSEKNNCLKRNIFYIKYANLLDMAFFKIKHKKQAIYAHTASNTKHNANIAC